MLYWKNKPIDALTPDELRAAMTESVGMVLKRNGQDNTNDVLIAFAAGAFTSLVVLGVMLIVLASW